jgi:hypothetical protein
VPRQGGIEYKTDRQFEFELHRVQLLRNKDAAMFNLRADRVFRPEILKICNHMVGKALRWDEAGANSTLTHSSAPIGLTSAHSHARQFISRTRIHLSVAPLAKYENPGLWFEAGV